LSLTGVQGFHDILSVKPTNQYLNTCIQNTIDYALWCQTMELKI